MEILIKNIKLKKVIYKNKHSGTQKILIDHF